MAKSTNKAGAKQPKESSGARVLRLTLRLDEADWKTFLWHARIRFAEFERSQWCEADEALRIEEVPEE